MKLDKTDEEILKLLKKDSRASNISIANSLGITEGTVRWRVKKLLDNGTIRNFTITIAESQEKFAVLMVKARNETKKMMSAVAALGIHFEAYEIAGEYDGCVILEGATVEEIDRKIDRIRKLKEVSDTRTYISFRRY